MFDIYMYISFLLMALIFLRQISIFKQPNKINYAPLILGIGAIASVLHFIISPENQSLMFVLKGSFIPFLVALMLYIIMNIMHQTQIAQNERTRSEFTKALIEQLSKLKSFTENLEARMMEYANEERELRSEFMARFNKDIDALNKLQQNQEEFLKKFEEAKEYNKELSSLFIHFTEVKLPELDSIIHKHLESLRITEAQHYENLSSFLQDTLGSKERVSIELENIHKEVISISSKTEHISNEIIEKSIIKVQNVTSAFEKELDGLKSLTQGLKTMLNEGENKILSIKAKGDGLINQIETVGNKLQELESKKEILGDISIRFMALLDEIERVKKEYINYSSYLENNLKNIDEKTKSEFLLLSKKIDKVYDLLDELMEKHQNTTTDISENVKLLAKKAQMQKGGYNISE